jgi:hypothetical protein
LMDQKTRRSSQGFSPSQSSSRRDLTMPENSPNARNNLNTE